MAQYDVDIRDYWRILKKRKLVIVLVTVLVGLSSYGFTKLREPTQLYSASSAIKIDRFTNVAALLTGAYFSQGENLETHAYIITSYPVLIMAAKKLGWIPDTLSVDDVKNHQKWLSQIQKLKSMVDAKIQEGTNIINITAISENPQESARVANVLAQVYQDYNIQEKNRKTFETKAFIEAQLQKTAKSLKESEDRLQSFREGYALISMDAQTTKVLDNLNEAEKELSAAKNTRQKVEAQYRLLVASEKTHTNLSGEFLFSPPSDSPLPSLLSRLSNLLLERQDLLINYTEQHPKVIENEDKINAVIAEMKKELNALDGNLKEKEANLEIEVNQLRKQSLGLPEKALQLLRLQREVRLQVELYTQLETKYQETLINESGKVQEVTIVRPALAPTKPFNLPAKSMVLITGIVMGLVIGVVLAFGMEVFDTSIGTIEDVEDLLKIPVLGVIPHFGKDDRTRRWRKKGVTDRDRRQDLIAHYDPKSLPAEAFRTLRSNLEFMRVNKKDKTFLVTSAFVEEGKTFNVVNLALSMAQAGSRVLLIGADLRRPVIHKMFGLNRQPGLTDYVLGNYSWREVRKSIADVMLGDFELEEILRTPGLDNLSIISSGTTPPNPAEILRSDRFKSLLREAREEYDLIFIDSPPILPVADATEISTYVDGVLLVYMVGKIGRGVLKRAKASLDTVKANVIGIVLNNIKPEAGPDYFRYHTQYYYGAQHRADAG